MAVSQRVKRITHAMVHTCTNSSPDMRNIWQCRKKKFTGEMGLSLECSAPQLLPGPGKGCWEEKYEPVPEFWGKHSLRSTKGVSESLFSCLVSVLDTNNFLPNSNCRLSCFN